MKATLYHLQINIDYKNVSFYKEFMNFLEWKILFEMEGVVGFEDENGASLWFLDSQKKEQGDYDKTGVNHISIRVAQQKQVDETVDFLKEKNVPALFETPRHRPEFALNENEDYYQVMFKTVDNVLFEVVYVGVK